MNVREGRRAASFLICVAVLAGASNAGAQGARQLVRPSAGSTKPDSVKCDPRAVRDANLPHFEIRRLPRLGMIGVDSLRGFLRSKCWPQALNIYLRNYQAELPSWVVYVDDTGSVTQGLVHARDTSAVMAGQRYIWVMLFMDHPIGPDSATLAARAAADRATFKKAEAAAAADGKGWAAIVVDSVKARQANDADGHARTAALHADTVARLDSLAAVPARGRRVTAAMRARAKATRAAAASLHKTSDSLAVVSRDASNKLAQDSASFRVAEQAWKDAINAARDSAAAAAQAADSFDVRFARRTKIYKTDPTLATAFSGLLKLVGAITPADVQLPDSTRALRLQRISVDSIGGMWAAYGRFALVENIASELALSPGPGRAFDFPLKGVGVGADTVWLDPFSRDSVRRVRSWRGIAGRGGVATGGVAGSMARDTSGLMSIYTNFANAKQHRLEVGVLVGATDGPRVPTYDPTTLRVTSLSPKVQFNTSLIGILNLKWWQAPGTRPQDLQRISLGIFAGTNVLTGSIGDQIVAGAALGHLWSPLGLDAGVSWLQGSRLRAGRISHLWAGRFLFGTDFRF